MLTLARVYTSFLILCSLPVLFREELVEFEEYRPHQLKGDHKGQWECHIQPNWLMTWEQNDKQLTLLFLETGTHADIFGW